MKNWNKTQIKYHVLAAKKLGLIKNEVALFIKSNKNIYEKDVLDFIKTSYENHGLINDDEKEFAIIAFAKNTKEIHYFPKGKGRKLTTNNLILLDIWARINSKNATYADATFMFYFGNKVPNEIQRKWKVLTKSRDTAIKYTKNKTKKGKLPRGLDIDRIAHDVIGKAGFGENIKHTVGHSLGFDHPHGKLPGINWREYSPIQKNVGYTIEPGMYFSNFGLRTEIDFYIDEKIGLVVSTPIQKNITLV